jgi:transposase-like protein
LEFRQMAVERMKRCENMVALSEELGVSRRLLYRWRDQLDPIEGRQESPPESPRESTLRMENLQRKRLLAEKTLEVDFSRVPCKQSRTTQEVRRRWREGVPDQIRGVMSKQGSLSIERMCYLAQVSRVGFYRSLCEQMPVEEEMEVRSAI